jgi:hypothetical protein
VAVLAATRAVSGHPSSSSLALTPDRLAEGKLWLFVTSAVIVNGQVLPQLIGLAATLIVAVRWLGRAFVAALMIAAHIGATLLGYATLELFTGDADGAHNRDLDYGISAVWMAVAGALTVAALDLRGRRRTLAVAFGMFTFVASVALFPLLAATEHGFAFAIGVGAGCVRRSSRHRAQALVARLDAAHPRRPHKLHRLHRARALDVEPHAVSVLDRDDRA